MSRHAAATAVVTVTAALSLFGATTTAVAASQDAYISNPSTDPSLQDFCDDQATLANNLRAQGHEARAEEVVGTANMRGCRIFTFESP